MCGSEILRGVGGTGGTGQNQNWSLENPFFPVKTCLSQQQKNRNAQNH